MFVKTVKRSGSGDLTARKSKKEKIRKTRYLYIVIIYIGGGMFSLKFKRSRIAVVEREYRYNVENATIQFGTEAIKKQF